MQFYQKEAAELRNIPLVLPPTAARALHTLTPLYSFLHNEVTEESLEKFASELETILAVNTENEDPFAQAMNWLLEKIRLTQWSVKNLPLSPNWTPKSILELCTEQPSVLSTVKQLTGLRHLCDNEEFLKLLSVSEPSSIDLFLGFSATVKFVDYLFSFSKGSAKSSDDISSSDLLNQVEKLLEQMLKSESIQLSLQLLEDMFSLFFLRREDVLFEETASDSGDAEEAGGTYSPSPSLVKADSSMKSKLSSDPSRSNSNSPSGTASSVALSSKNKSDVSLGFLCQRPDKLQVCIIFLSFVF